MAGSLGGGVVWAELPVCDRISNHTPEMLVRDARALCRECGLRYFGWALRVSDRGATLWARGCRVENGVRVWQWVSMAL